MPQPAARLVLATHNRGKVTELRSMLAQADGSIAPESVLDAGQAGLGAPAETGTSFAENALIKARAAAAQTGLPVIADDSGLCVEVMNGAPGIFSARWAGAHGDDAANLALLLEQMEEIPDSARAASFVCAAVLVTPQGQEIVEYGQLSGTLLRAPAGEGGFGYDPILRPEGHERSCAQLSPQEKNRISHRGQAMAALLPSVLECLAMDGA